MAIAANEMKDRSRRSGAEIETPFVYVSILNWNGVSQTEECLSSLFL